MQPNTKVSLTYKNVRGETVTIIGVVVPPDPPRATLDVWVRYSTLAGFDWVRAYPWELTVVNKELCSG